jgi:transposase
MPRAYSGDLRERVIAAVESGASRREAAERFDISVSSAIKWVQCWCQTGRAALRPRGGSVSPLEDDAKERLALVAEQPDLTLDETVIELRKRRVRTSRSSLWRFLDRHDITLKKNFASGRAAARRRGSRPPALDARARFA